MDKKTLIVILVVGIILLSGFVLWSMERKQRPEVTKQELLQKFQTLKTQYEQVKAQGYDVSEVERLAREARNAHRRGDNQRAKELAKQAVTALKNAKKIS